METLANGLLHQTRRWCYARYFGVSFITVLVELELVQ
jgi:hypothetical protein